MLKKNVFLSLIAVCLLSVTFTAECAVTQPFKWSWRTENDGTELILTLETSSKTAYIYADSTVVAVMSGIDGIDIAVMPPEKKMHSDAVSGENVPVYENGARWRIPFPKSAQTLSIKIEWQGCDGNSCYMPESADITVPFSGKNASETIYPPPSSAGNKNIAVKTDGAAGLPPFEILRSAAGYMSASDFIAFLKGESPAHGMFSGKGILLVILLSFLGGIALNLTPCVLPLIPVNLAMIGVEPGTGSRKKAFVRGTAYALGMAAAYGAAGLAAVLGGASFGAIASSWQFNAAAAFIFVLLGLAMFDLFFIDFSRMGGSLKMPSGAKLTGVFLMGAFTALLAGACVAPVVIAVLIYSTGEYAKGEMFALFLPFILGIGMGFPWPFAAAGLASVPKPGAWMVHIKHFFGILIIGIGVYYGFTAAQLLFRSGAFEDESGNRPLEMAFGAARETGMPLMIDFSAEWCKNCKAMDATTFRDPAVMTELERFVFVKFDATDVNSPEVKSVLDGFGVKGLPAYIIVKVE